VQTIENKDDSGVIVTLDDKHFVNCRFKNCTLTYSGGDYAWTNTTFENCPITFSGSAQRTFNLLGTFGIVKPDQLRPAAGPAPETRKVVN